MVVINRFVPSESLKNKKIDLEKRNDVNKSAEFVIFVVDIGIHF